MPDQRRMSNLSCLKAGILGCAAAMLLMVCRRRCVQILGPGPDAGIACAAVFLGGIVAGLAFFAIYFKSGAALRSRLPIIRPSLEQVVPPLILLAMASIVAGQRLTPILNVLAAGAADFRAAWFGNASICFPVAAIMDLLPALATGFLLACLAKQATGSESLDERNDNGLKKSSAWLIGLSFGVGGIVGLVLGSNWLIPELGTMPALAIVLFLLALILAVLIIRAFPLKPLAMLPLALAGIIVYSLGTGLGAGYFYGRKRDLIAPPQSVFFRVGQSGDVRVSRRQGGQSIEFDGVPIGGTGQELAGEVGLAVFPRLLRPAAKHVLVIGLGTGATCGASLLFPETIVTCSEPEPAIVAAANFFTNVNYQPIASHSFFLASRDGRRLLEAARQKFDLILLNYGDGRLPDAARFFSTQFYSLAKTRLASGGIVAHRLKLDSFSPADLGLISRTVLAAFPRCGLVRVSESEGILLASDSELLGSTNALQESQSMINSNQPIGAALDRFFTTRVLARLLVAHLWLDEDGLGQLARRDFETTQIRDWNRHLGPVHRTALEELSNQALVLEFIAAAAGCATFENTFKRCGCAKAEADLFHQAATVLAAHHQRGSACKTIAVGLRVDPGQPDLLADELIWRREDEPKVIEETISRIEKRSLEAAIRVGMEFRQQGDYRSAIAVFQHLTKQWPESATLWYNLAMNYLESGDQRMANDCFKHSLNLDPGNHAIMKSAEITSKGF